MARLNSRQNVWFNQQLDKADAGEVAKRIAAADRDLLVMTHNEALAMGLQSRLDVERCSPLFIECMDLHLPECWRVEMYVEDVLVDVDANGAKRLYVECTGGRA